MLDAHVPLESTLFEDNENREAAESDDAENRPEFLGGSTLLAQKVDEGAQLGRPLRTPRRIQIR